MKQSPPRPQTQTKPPFKMTFSMDNSCHSKCHFWIARFFLFSLIFFPCVDLNLLHLCAFILTLRVCNMAGTRSADVITWRYGPGCVWVSSPRYLQSWSVLERQWVSMEKLWGPLCDGIISWELGVPFLESLSQREENSDSEGKDTNAVSRAAWSKIPILQLHYYSPCADTGSGGHISPERIEKGVW